MLLGHFREFERNLMPGKDPAYGVGCEQTVTRIAKLFGSSQDAVQWAVGGGELVDSAGYFRVLD